MLPRAGPRAEIASGNLQHAPAVKGRIGSAVADGLPARRFIRAASMQDSRPFTGGLAPPRGDNGPCYVARRRALGQLDLGLS